MSDTASDPATSSSAAAKSAAGGPAPDAGARIRLEEVTRVYRTRGAPIRAVGGISLDLGPGVTALVGPNGAGKTTLIGLILGFLRPTDGAVTIDGASPRRWIRRHGAACLPERFQLPPEWTVGAALRAFAGLDGHRPREADHRVAATLDRLGLTPYERRPMGALSRGMTQRVGLAQALLADRALVVLDEPTEGLDPLWRVRFREIVDELRDAGRTVILASHELPEIERVADRVVLLLAGRIQEVVEMDAAAGPLRYRLDADADDAVLQAAFPGAERTETGITVTVADARDLSDRLAALLERGATLRAVAPEGAGLEERVRRGGVDEENA